MSRSRKDIIDTEAMLNRLQALGITREDAEALRRISMTLRRWFEAECNGEVERDETDGKPYHYYRGHIAPQGTLKIVTRRYSVPDREAGALKRLAAIMAKYPTLQSYVQTDPRGASLYVLRPGDVPPGEKAESYYSRGIAVYK